MERRGRGERRERREQDDPPPPYRPPRPTSPPPPFSPPTPFPPHLPAPALGVARAHATWMQGLWFATLARVLFEGRRAWDPRYHGGYMFLPAAFAFWAIGAGFVCVAAFVVAAAVGKKRSGYGRVGGGGDEEGGAVEASPGGRAKTEMVRLA